MAGGRGGRRIVGIIDFFVYSRATPSAASTGHDRALDEQHWSYMDRFADGMVARGPTLAADRETWTGSLHILDLPSVGAAREFVEHEPYNRAGLFDRHHVWRFENRLGRTMWEAEGTTDDARFLVIANTSSRPDFPAPERLIVHGELLTPEDGRPAGVALALAAPSRQAVEALFPNPDVEILDWEFGGRR